MRWHNHSPSFSRCLLNTSITDNGKPLVPRKGVYRILVCRPNHRLGNTLLLTPLISELERLYPGAEIDLLSEGDIAKDVFSSFFSVRNIHCLPRRGFKHPVAFLSVLRKVRGTHYDLVVDPCVGSGFSRLLTKFVNGRCKLGFSDLGDRSGLTHAVPCAVAPRHMARRALQLVRAEPAAAARTNDDDPSLDIRLTDAERAQGQAVVHELLAAWHPPYAGPVIGIFANATGAKRYPASWWSEFIAALRGISPHARLIEIIPMHGRSMLDSAWPGYFSSDIRRMAAVMAGMDLVISADCGVMHLAVAARVPTAGMFCVTDAAVYAPYGHGSCALPTRELTATEAAGRVVDAFQELLIRGAAAHGPVHGLGATHQAESLAQAGRISRPAHADA